MHSPQLRRGQLGSTALRVDLGVSYIRNSSVRKICLFPSLYLGISLNQYGLIDLILLVIIQHYFVYDIAQIVPALTIGSFFSLLLCAFDIISPFVCACVHVCVHMCEYLAPSYF